LSTSAGAAAEVAGAEAEVAGAAVEVAGAAAEVDGAGAAALVAGAGAAEVDGADFELQPNVTNILTISTVATRIPNQVVLLLFIFPPIYFCLLKKHAE